MIKMKESYQEDIKRKTEFIWTDIWDQYQRYKELEFIEPMVSRPDFLQEHCTITYKVPRQCGNTTLAISLFRKAVIGKNVYPMLVLPDHNLEEWTKRRIWEDGEPWYPPADDFYKEVNRRIVCRHELKQRRKIYQNLNLIIVDNYSYYEQYYGKLSTSIYEPIADLSKGHTVVVGIG